MIVTHRTVFASNIAGFASELGSVRRTTESYLL